MFTLNCQIVSLRDVSELNTHRLPVDFRTYSAQVKDAWLCTSSALLTELHMQLMSQKSCTCIADDVHTVSMRVYTLVLTLLYKAQSALINNAFRACFACFTTVKRKYMFKS